jgi:hypothetical protein
MVSCVSVHLASLSPGRKIRVQYTEASTATTTASMDIFLKTCKPGSQADQFNDLIGTFDREADFYSSTFPKMAAFVKDKVRVSQVNILQLV